MSDPIAIGLSYWVWMKNIITLAYVNKLNDLSYFFVTFIIICVLKLIRRPS